MKYIHRAFHKSHPNCSTVSSVSSITLYKKISVSAASGGGGSVDQSEELKRPVVVSSQWRERGNGSVDGIQQDKTLLGDE